MIRYTLYIYCSLVILLSTIFCCWIHFGCSKWWTMTNKEWRTHNKRNRAIRATNTNSKCPAKAASFLKFSGEIVEKLYCNTCDLMGRWMITWLHAHKELPVTSAAFFFQLTLLGQCCPALSLTLSLLQSNFGACRGNQGQGQFSIILVLFIHSGIATD